MKKNNETKTLFFVHFIFNNNNKNRRIDRNLVLICLSAQFAYMEMSHLLKNKKVFKCVYTYIKNLYCFSFLIWVEMKF